MLGEKKTVYSTEARYCLFSNLTLFFFHSLLFPLPTSYLSRAFIGIMRTCVIAVSSLKGECYINTGYFMCAYKIYLRWLKVS